MLALPVFGELERLVSDFYPYRYVITPLLLLAGAAALYLAYQRGAHRLLLQHRTASLLIGVPLAVITVVAADYLVSPLWERTHLEEASPLEAADVPASTPSANTPALSTPSAPAQPAAAAAITHQGEFLGADDFHFGRGDAQLIRTPDGKHVLRFENFSVRNGPDLYVYLSRDPSGQKVEEALNLGRLKATDGAFNYEIPSGTDLEGVRSVVVWCRQFAVQFAVATLEAA